MAGSFSGSPRVAPFSLAMVAAVGLALAPVAPVLAHPSGAPRAAVRLGPAAAPPSEQAAPAPGPAPAPAPAPEAGAPPATAPTATEAAPPGDPAEAIRPAPPGDPAEATQSPGATQPTYGGDPAEALAPAPQPEPPPPEPAPPEPEPEPDDPPGSGIGLLITGGAITAAVGLPLTAVGTARYLEARDDTQLFSGLDRAIAVSMMTFGIIGLGAGLSLLTVGAIKNSRYRAWKREQGMALSPTVGRTAMGTTTAGLHLRF